MKKIILLFAFILTSSGIYSNGKKEIVVGLKNNQYGTAGYYFGDWMLGIEQSIFSENIKHQYIRFNLGYEKQLIECLSFSSQLYSGTEYAGGFYNLGGNLTGKLQMNKIALSAGIHPYYDSALDYFTCFKFEGGYRLTKEIVLHAGYANDPEFRLPEKQFNIGLIFNSSNLFVKPEILIPTEGASKSIRVRCSFTYSFKL